MSKVCEVCGEEIPARQYQAETVRACRPSCASELANREHPDLCGKWNRGPDLDYPEPS